MFYHYRGIRIRIQSANQGVSVRVDWALAFYGLLVDGLAVHIQCDLLSLHADHHLVPLGVEEHGQTGEGNGLQVSVGTHQEVLQGLLVPVELQAGLFVALLIHDLPDVPHFVDCVFDHAEGHHEGVLIREAPGKVQPGSKRQKNKGLIKDNRYNKQAI